MHDTVEFEENNIILLRKVNFAFMIPNPSLDCSYVLNFWPNLSLVLINCSYKKRRVFPKNKISKFSPDPQNNRMSS